MLDRDIELVVLDRDGVINQDSPNYIRSEAEFIPIQGSVEAIVRLQRAGKKVAIATNQSGVGRGYFSKATLLAMHQKLERLLIDHGGRALDHITHCPHLPDAGCACRKPGFGMLAAIADRLGFCQKKQKMCMIGDSTKDIEAAKAFGIKGILVATGNGKKSHALMPEVPYFANLMEVTGALLDDHEHQTG